MRRGAGAERPRAQPRSASPAGAPTGSGSLHEAPPVAVADLMSPAARAKKDEHRRAGRRNGRPTGWRAGRLAGRSWSHLPRLIGP